MSGPAIFSLYSSFLIPSLLAPTNHNNLATLLIIPPLFSTYSFCKPNLPTCNRHLMQLYLQQATLTSPLRQSHPSHPQLQWVLALCPLQLPHLQHTSCTKAKTYQEERPRHWHGRIPNASPYLRVPVQHRWRESGISVGFIGWDIITRVGFTGFLCWCKLGWLSRHSPLNDKLVNVYWQLSHLMEVRETTSTF